MHEGEGSTSDTRVHLRHRADLPSGVSVAFTASATGNLGLHVLGTSDPQEHRRRIERGIGLDPGSLLFLEQVHGTDVVLADEAPLIPMNSSAEEERALAPVADAALTKHGRPLAIMTADCLPVIVTSSNPLIYAVAHAGRQGLLHGVLPNAIESLRAAGGTDLQAWIGPSICGRCYEVPPDMAHDAEAKLPGIAVKTRWGSPGLDLPAAAEKQLRSLGVEVHRKVINECTFEQDDLFSHRRAPGQGRIAGLVWRRGHQSASSRTESMTDEGDVLT